MKISSCKSNRFLKKLKLFNKEILAKERKLHVVNVYTNLFSQSHKHIICVLATLVADKDIINLYKLMSLK